MGVQHTDNAEMNSCFFDFYKSNLYSSDSPAGIDELKHFYLFF